MKSLETIESYIKPQHERSECPPPLLRLVSLYMHVQNVGKACKSSG